MGALRLAALVTLTAGAAAGLFALSHRAQRAARPPSVRREPAAAGLDSSGRTHAEVDAIKNALRNRLRPAGDSDGTPSDPRNDMLDLYVDYHPFFVRGDLDGDGQLDFAQAFVLLGDGEARFDVAVFFGRPGGVFSDPVWIEKDAPLSAGDLSIERTLLIVTPDLSVDEARRWRYDAAEKRFLNADVAPAEDTDSDAPDESPDARPRARI